MDALGMLCVSGETSRPRRAGGPRRAVERVCSATEKGVQGRREQKVTGMESLCAECLEPRENALAVLRLPLVVPSALWQSGLRLR